jgi:hypothetical protein
MYPPRPPNVLGRSVGRTFYVSDGLYEAGSGSNR